MLGREELFQGELRCCRDPAARLVVYVLVAHAAVAVVCKLKIVVLGIRASCRALPLHRGDGSLYVHLQPGVSAALGEQLLLLLFAAYDVTAVQMPPTRFKRHTRQTRTAGEACIPKGSVGTLDVCHAMYQFMGSFMKFDVSHLGCLCRHGRHKCALDGLHTSLHISPTAFRLQPARDSLSPRGCSNAQTERSARAMYPLHNTSRLVFPCVEVHQDYPSALTLSLFLAFVCLCCRLTAAGALVLRFEMQRADVAERGHNGSGRFGEPNGHFR